MLTIVTWLWGDKYSPADVAKLQGGVWRNLHQDYRIICITAHCEGPPETLEHKDTGPITLYELPKDATYLIHTKGCFIRLKLFDPAWQSELGIEPGDRVVNMDLDTVVTGALDPLFNKPDNFSILTGANASNPCPYNGSLWQFRAGYRPDVWTDFSLDAADKVPFDSFPDDQAWFAHKMPGVVGWKVGSPSGVYAYQKPGWPKGEALPKDARMVVFFGWRKPEKFKQLPWVQEHWRT